MMMKTQAEFMNDIITLTSVLNAQNVSKELIDMANEKIALCIYRYYNPVLAVPAGTVINY